MIGVGRGVWAKVVVRELWTDVVWLISKSCNAPAAFFLW